MEYYVIRNEEDSARSNGYDLNLVAKAMAEIEREEEKAKSESGG